MGHRLSKIYTRTGDDGTTGLGDGSRISKDDARASAMGDVDELNCQLGIVISMVDNDEINSLFERIQHDLFDLGGELAVPGYQMISDERVNALEKSLDSLNEHLPPLKNFILPGGNGVAAHCHLARAICRRAERSIVTLSKQAEINTALRNYINRLSDLLFVTARTLALQQGGKEVLWVQADQRD